MALPALQNSSLNTLAAGQGRARQEKPSSGKRGERHGQEFCNKTDWLAGGH
jgi:hypothetical protein